MGKVKAILEQRSRVLSDLRDTCRALADARSDHTGYLLAFLKDVELEAVSTQPGDTGKEGETDATRTRYFAPVDLTGAKYKETIAREGIEEEWPLKGVWVQVLVLLVTGKVINRESRIVQQIIQERMADYHQTVTLTWLRHWLSNSKAGWGALLAKGIGWPWWKEAFLRKKLECLAYGRLNRAWILANAPLEKLKRKFGFHARFGKAKVAEPPSTKIVIHGADQGGGELMMQLGVRAVTPRPSSVLALDLQLGDAVEEEEGSLGVAESSQLIYDLVQAFLEPELDQLPGFICTRVGLLPGRSRVLRVAAYFSQSLPADFWIDGFAGTVEYWPAPQTIAEWFRQPELTLKGCNIEMEVTCRLSDNQGFAAGSSSLEFGSIKGIPNPLYAWYTAVSKVSESDNHTENDYCLANAMEKLVCKGAIQSILSLQMVSQERFLTATLEQTAA